MPTLQEMHKITASSPRSTAMFYLTIEELSSRHLSGIDRIERGNFKVVRVTNVHDSEDDFASSGSRGVSDYCLSAFQPHESQARGFVHGHRKEYNVPNGHDEQFEAFLKVVRDTDNNAEQDGDVVQLAVADAELQYNEKAACKYQLEAIRVCNSSCAAVGTERSSNTIHRPATASKQIRWRHGAG